MLVLGFIVLTGQADPLTITKRIDLLSHSIHITYAYLLSGTGLGNYLVAQNKYPILYSYYFQQPVHNIFFLYLAEVGLPIGALTVWFLKDWLTKNWRNLIFRFLILVILLTGLFDHYWLTLQQNFLLLPVIFGLLDSHRPSASLKD
jgi:hypothetical protein